jgi:carbon monoxide dehydrogenase subunit G
MSEVVHSRSVAAPVEAVWSVLSDFAKLADWAPMISHSSTMTETLEGVGATRRVAVDKAVLLERVVEWEPEAALAYELEGLPPIIASAVTRWELTAAGAATQVSLTATIEPGPRLPMKAAAAVVVRKIGATNKSLLECLAAEAEKTGADT